MRRARSRWLLTFVAAVLVASMLPVGAAPGIVESGGGSSRPVKTPGVKVQAHSSGMTVAVSNLDKDVTGFDVYRSTTSGDLGEKLNDEPVGGTRYRDRTAQPGAQYYYTVKVAGRSEGGSKETQGVAASYLTPDTLPQVKADVIPAKQVRVRAAADQEPRLMKAEPVASPSIAALPEAIVKMQQEIGTGSGVTTLPASATWSPAGGPYFIRNDLVVPVGRTLTILPGTKVYFDTTESGETTRIPFPGVQSVTPQIDLIVHGKIVAKGTSTAPIVFSSVNSTVASGTATAASGGDWGCVFVDSMQPSEVAFCEFEFGTMGVWGHNTSRPYVTSSSFRMMDDYGYPWGAVSFTNPKTDLTTPRIRIVGNRIDPGGGEGIDIHYTSLGENTLDRVLDPYIANNVVTGSYPLEMYAYDFPWQEGEPGVPAHGGKYGNMIIKGTVVNNKFTTDDSAIYLEVVARGDNKHGYIQTAFSGNTIVAKDYDGIYGWAESNGLNGSAYVKPTFSADKISSSSDDGVDLQAYAEDETGTGTGNAYVTPTMTNCQVTASGADAVSLYAEAEGGGTASVNGVFSGGSLQSSSESAVDASAYSEFGPAHASPTFTKVALRALNSSDALSACAYAYDTGLAKASPRITGGSVWGTSDDAVYAYAMSYKGPAEASPYVASSDVRGYYCGIYANAYASYQTNDGTSTAVSSPVVMDTSVKVTYSEAIEAYANSNNNGAATCSPAITRCDITSEQGYGIDTFAGSWNGNTTCSPVLTDLSIWSYDCSLYAYADSYGSGGAVTSANASPKLTRVTGVSKYYDTLNIYAYNYGKGSAYAKPALSYCDIINVSNYSDSMYVYAEVQDSGTAEAAPVASYSNFKAEYEALDIEAGAYGGASSNAKSNGAFTNCTMSSSNGNGYYGHSWSSLGTSQNSPTFTNCTVESPTDYAYEFQAWAHADAKSVTAAPMITGGKISYSGNGIDVFAGSDYGQSGGTLAVLTAPQIKNVPIVAHWDYAIQTCARGSGDGTITNNSYVYNCPSTSYSGILHEALTESSSTGAASNNAKTHGVSSASKMRVVSTNNNGIYNWACSARGSASDRSETKYCNISSQSSAVSACAQSNSDSGNAVTVSPLIYGNYIDDGWVLTDSAIEVAAYENGTSTSTTMTLSPTISANTIAGANGDAGVLVHAWSNWGSESPISTKAVISGNSINGVFLGEGIAVRSDNGPWTDDSSVTITKNTITRPGKTGIAIKGVKGGTVLQNKVIEPGWSMSTADEWDTACLKWNGADASKANVTGNMFVGARGTAVYYPNGGAKTQYNSFTNCNGMVNRPFNVTLDDNATSTATPYDFRYNWWGTTNTSAIAQTVNLPGYSGAKADIVNYAGYLKSCQPKVVYAAHSHPASGKVRFVLKFDRPMDKAVTKLYFGKSSPYRSYSVTGKWSADGKTWTSATRSTTGLPTKVRLYFSGAKDLPGNLMLPTSKYLVL